jgi:hypothetical protein
MSVYFRADSPYSEASIRVGHFLKALRRNASHMKRLTVVAASDRYYEAKCPWDILFAHHPVSQELEQYVVKKPVKHLKIRLHDDALFFPGYACWLRETFYGSSFEVGGEPSREQTLTFVKSCTCPPGCPV